MKSIIDPLEVKHSLSVMECLISPKRYEIVRLLAAHGDINVKKLTRLLNLNYSGTTKHLLLLHDAGYVKRVRKGKSIYYSLQKPRLLMIANIADMLAV